MSKIWLFALILSCAAAVALAKDKDKGSGGSGSSNRDTSKRAPAASAPRSTPAPAPRQSPALGPAQRPSEAPPATQRPTPAPKSNPAPAPVPKAAPAPEPLAGKSATPKSDPPTQQTEPQPRSSSRPASPPAASQPATPTAPNTKSSGAALPAAPSGKTGTAFGPQPAPKSAEKVESGRPLRPSAESSHEHKHSTNSPPPTTTPSKPLPTPPKLETSRKIPAFGSPLTGTSKEHQPGHDHSHSVPQKSASQPIVRDHDHDHDHDHNDDHHHGHPGSGHSHRHGSRSSNRLSWLIIGGSLFGPTSYGYGFGYGPGYGVPYAPRRVYVPVQPYDATVNMKPAPISGPPAQTQLTLDEFAALPLERQRELLLQALNALEDDLARSPNGDVWSRHLQLATIAKLVTEGNEPPNATTRARLRSIVVLFEEVAANTEYRQVSDLLSFRALHLGLLEFSAEPIDRARRQLSQAAFGLSKTLEAWSSGPSWRDYLQVPWLIGTEEELKLDLDARQARFEKLLEKFDRVQADEQFRAVNQTQEFRRTHESLRRFVRDLQVFVEQIRREESANTESANPSDP